MLNAPHQTYISKSALASFNAARAPRKKSDVDEEKGGDLYKLDVALKADAKAIRADWANYFSDKTSYKDIYTLGILKQKFRVSTADIVGDTYSNLLFYSDALSYKRLFTPELVAKIEAKLNSIKESQGNLNDYSVQIPLFKTSHMFVHASISSDNDTRTSFIFRINVQAKEVKNTIKVVGKDGIQSVLVEMLNSWMVEGLFLPVFDFSYEIPEKSKVNGTVKLDDGTLFYLPKDNLDRRQSFVDLIKQDGRVPANKAIFFDFNKQIFCYTNNDREIKYYAIKNFQKLSLEDIRALLEDDLELSITSVNTPSSIGAMYRAFPREDWMLDQSNDKKPLYQLHAEGVLQPFLKKLQQDVQTRYTAQELSPVTYCKLVAKIQALYHNLPKYEQIKETVIKRREGFNKATAADLPSIPSLNSELFWFPHQAEALAKLNHAGSTAIIDVGTGGGKTCILIADILNLMGQGKVTRPLIILPGSLMAQWMGQIEFFTGGKINCVVLSSETALNWGKKPDNPNNATGYQIVQEGLKELKAVADNAPPNTIFLTTYSFCRKRQASDIDWMNEPIYPMAEWLKTVVKPDYVALDEAHYIKNKSNQRKSILTFRDAEFRRVATGTLIPNTPIDLIGQMMFLDSRIVGSSEKEFRIKYGVIQRINAKGKPAFVGWKSNFQELIRRDLRDRSFYLKYSEKDWCASLPKLRTGWHFAEMTATQKAIYKKLLKDIISEIETPPNPSDFNSHKDYEKALKKWGKVKEQWDVFQKTQGSLEEDDTVAYSNLLVKFMKLEQYVAAPDHNMFIRDGLKEVAPEDKISPKLKIVDELIEKSLAAGEKVIVACNFKWNAAHFKKYSRFGDKGLYYDASHKENLQAFIKSDTVKILFAVQQSISEGLNLQMANRIIICTIDWTPGKTKQLIARIWRPTGTKVDVKKEVFIDYVLANESVDMAKSMRLIFKRARNSAIIDESPIATPAPPEMNTEMFEAGITELRPYLQAEMGLNDWVDGVIEERRKTGDFEPLEAKHDGEIQGKKIQVPWVLNMPLPLGVKGKPLLEVMEDEGLITFAQAESAANVNDDDDDDDTTGDSDDDDANDSNRLKMSDHKEWLMDRYVMTEFGPGKIIGARINSVRIKFSEGGTGSVKAGRLFLLDKVAAPKKGDKVRQSKVSPKVPKSYDEPKPNPKKDNDTKPVKPPKTEPKPATPAASDNQVEILISMYNGIYSLIADVEDPDSKKLKKLGFRFQGQYYLLKIKNKQMGQTVMKALKRKFNIPKKNVDIIEEMFDEMKRSKYIADPPDNLKLFLRLSHQIVDDKKTLRVYPLVEDDGLYLVVNKKTHPHLTPSKLKVGAFTWKTERGYWYYFAKNRTALKTMVKTLSTQKKSFLTVTNIPELKEAIKEHYNVKV